MIAHFVCIGIMLVLAALALVEERHYAKTRKD